MIDSARQVLLSSSILFRGVSPGKIVLVLLFSVLRWTSMLYVRYCRKQDTDNCGLTGTRFRRRNEDYLQ